jgi:hypothetical protein
VEPSATGSPHWCPEPTPDIDHWSFLPKSDVEARPSAGPVSSRHQFRSTRQRHTLHWKTIRKSVVATGCQRRDTRTTRGRAHQLRGGVRLWESPDTTARCLDSMTDDGAPQRAGCCSMSVCGPPARPKPRPKQPRGCRPHLHNRAVARLRSFLQSRSLVRPQVPNGSLFLRGVLRQSALTWHPEQSA